jgi:phenylalanyl-tRNA synthetase beta subunit
MKTNPLKDKKLYKFIDQNQAIKAIMDHISKLGIAPKEDEINGKKESNKKTPEPEKVSKSNKVVIKKFDEEFKIIFDPSVKEVRGFILCCIINNVQLTPQLLKEFLQFQTKLHDGICKKRELATIATHDFDLVLSNTLRYAAKNKDDIKIMPLGRHKDITANEYYTKMKDEADAIRKEKKRSQFTGIHKFLHLLDDQQNFSYLETVTGTTLSLPPLTNSEVTRLSPNTKRILVEVTSSSNAPICSLVMSQLLAKLLDMSSSAEGESKALELEQVRILNVDGNLKTLFPSKIDLQELENESTEIVRP